MRKRARMRDAMNLCGRLLALVAVLGILTTSCSKSGGNKAAGEPDGSQPAAAGPSLATEVQPIFDDNCVACHQTGSAQQGLVLEAGKSFANIVGVKSHESSLK